jgi:hypothetical protein
MILLKIAQLPALGVCLVAQPQPTLTRYGYNVKALSELLNVRAAEVRALLHGQLPEERTAELKQQILKTGIPL